MSLGATACCLLRGRGNLSRTWSRQEQFGLYSSHRLQLTPGSRLAQYEIVAAIGRGGTGEVFRARDGRLGRDVAIKVLPEEFTKEAERLARFERGARVLASLNHPHIASIHGLDVQSWNFVCRNRG